MWKKKLRLFLGILLLLIVVLCTTGIIFQFGTKQYVRNQIQEEMTKQIENTNEGILIGEFYSYSIKLDGTGTGKIMVISDVTGVINENQLVSISVITLNEYFDVKEENAFDEFDEIVEYCKKHKEMLNEDTYRYIESDGKGFYIMAREYTIDEKTAFAIYIATPDGLLEFVGKVNFIFILVMLVLGVALFLCSYNIGMAFERNKEKLTHYFQNASHELKTPIMSIQGYAEGIRTGVIKDTVKATEIILSESDRMNELVGEILFLSKMDTGYVNNTKEKINVADLLCDCTSAIAIYAKERGISTDVHTPKEFVYAMGNEVQLERAFDNILSNATRFAKEKITVEISREKKWIRIDIGNDGEKIADKDMPHIFERFYKGTNGGHGIGLAITKEVIKAHKGRIKVCNENGVKFSVWLKCVK